MSTLVKTDDPGRRQEFIWKGHPDFPWPFEARILAWVGAVLLVPAAWVVAWLIFPAFIFTGLGFGHAMGVVLHSLSAVALGTAAGISTVRWIGRHVKPTTPLRHHKAVLSEELDAPRTPDRITHRVQVRSDLFLDQRAENRHTYAVAIPDDFFESASQD